MLIWCSTAAD
uniref:Uncharacterized protein n=1 Tax=Arundo donax TaxID=35708 RepID=A0A0A9EE76_ARUDO